MLGTGSAMKKGHSRALTTPVVRFNSLDVERISLDEDMKLMIGLQGIRDSLSNRNRILQSDLEQLAVLGNGSYGTVFLVEHKITGTQYALKEVTKRRMIEGDVEENLLNEISMMGDTHSDFIIRLHTTYEDDNAYYLLEDLASGGELHRQLLDRGRFDNNTARFYVACVILAFEHMHQSDIIYRDLKPENILLNNEGYGRLTDLGFAKKLENGRTYTYCGTPCYMAPEIICGEPYGLGVDWWTLGIFTHELLCGGPPFRRVKPTAHHSGCSLSYSIVHQKFKCTKSYVKPEAIDFMNCLLEKNAHRRYGVIHGGVELIKNHPWFMGFDWKALEAHTVQPPIVPFVDDNISQSVERNFGNQKGRKSNMVAKQLHHEQKLKKEQDPVYPEFAGF